MHSLNQQLTLNKAPGNCATYCHCKCNWSELIHTETNLSFVKCKKKVKYDTVESFLFAGPMFADF